MKSLFLYIFTAIFILAGPVIANAQPPDGLYGIGKAGTPVTAPDGRVLNLGNILPDKIDHAVLQSRSNDNQQFYLSLEKKEAFSQDYSNIVLCAGGHCLSFNSGGSGGMFTIGAQLNSAETAEAVAKFLGIEIRKRKHPGHLFSVRYVLSKESFSQDEAIPATLEITNLGTSPAVFMPGGKNRGERDNQFGFTAYDGVTAVPDTGSPVHFGGLSSKTTIQPGETWKKDLDLRKWFTFKKPGVYEVTGTYEMNFVEPDSTDWFTIWQDYATAAFYVRIN